MKLHLARAIFCFLLGTVANAVEIEPGFPNDCGIPSAEREYKEEAEGMKVRATPHSWPWHVGLWSERRGEHPYCGGTLISRSLVVTSAHCVGSLVGCPDSAFGKVVQIAAQPEDRLHVLIGAHDYTQADASWQLRLVVYAVVHPNYNEGAEDSGYDIALLKLREPIPQDERVRPICFPSKNVVLQRGSIGYFTGWGGLYTQWSKDKLVFPKTLREAQVLMKFVESCTQFFGFRLPESNACIEAKDRNPCDGDSGGGLFCPSEDADNRWFLCGIVDGGAEGCRKLKKFSSGIVEGNTEVRLVSVCRLLKGKEYRQSVIMEQ
nr:unnamed protein product [Spirometra erinaceieuropaei]